jgi:hypothetical protein
MEEGTYRLEEAIELTGIYYNSFFYKFLDYSKVNIVETIARRVAIKIR